MPGYGDVWGAANEGADFSQNIINNYYHNQAQNALTQMYGPIAGNPAAALDMQNYAYKNSLNPMLLAGQGIANNQAQTNLDYDVANNPNRLKQNSALAGEETTKAGTMAAEQPNQIASDNATLAANAANAGPQGAAKTVADQSAATQSQLTTQQLQGYNHMKGVYAFGSAAQNALAANPGDVAGALAAGRNAAIMAGAAPSDVDALIQQQGDAFTKDPVGTIGSLVGQANAAQTGIVNGLDPKSKADLQNLMMEYNSKHAAYTKQTQDIFNDAKAKEDAILGAQGPAGETLIGVHTAQDALQTMQAILARHSMDQNGFVRSLKLEHAPGSDEAQFNSYADQVRAALSADKSSELRDGSGSSLSVRNQKEFEALGNTFGNFDVANLSGPQLAQQIARAGKFFNTVGPATEAELASNNLGYRNAVAERQKAQGDYHAALGIPDAPSPALSYGQFQGAAGPEAQPAPAAGGAGSPPPNGASPTSTPAAPPAAPAPAAASGTPKRPISETPVPGAPPFTGTGGQSTTPATTAPVNYSPPATPGPPANAWVAPRYAGPAWQGPPPDPAKYGIDQAGQAQFIRDYATYKGIDPRFALGVARAEGLGAIGPKNPNGASYVDRNPDGTPFSFGAFQLNVRNGLGNAARARGIDPANPAHANLANAFALDRMASAGLRDWKGDAAVSAWQRSGAVGSGTFTPTNGGAPVSAAPQQTASNGIQRIADQPNSPRNVQSPNAQQQPARTASASPAPPAMQGGGVPTGQSGVMPEAQQALLAETQAARAQLAFRSQVAQVMDGRALLAKYLTPQRRTA